MGHDPVARVEYPVAVFVSPERLLGIFNEVFDTKGIPDGIVEWHASRLNAIIGKVVPGKGIPVSYGEDGHLHADESVLYSRGEVVASVALNIVGDGAEPDKD